MQQRRNVDCDEIMNMNFSGKYKSIFRVIQIVLLVNHVFSNQTPYTVVLPDAWPQVLFFIVPIFSPLYSLFSRKTSFVYRVIELEADFILCQTLKFRSFWSNTCRVKMPRNFFWQTSTEAKSNLSRDCLLFFQLLRVKMPWILAPVPLTAPQSMSLGVLPRPHEVLSFATSFSFTIQQPSKLEKCLGLKCTVWSLT